MSVAEIKEEAIRQFANKIESLDDEQSLQMVLDFLNGIGKENQDQLNMSRHYESIKNKYSSVLQRLAQ